MLCLNEGRRCFHQFEPMHAYSGGSGRNRGILDHSLGYPRTTRNRNPSSGKECEDREWGESRVSRVRYTSYSPECFIDEFINRNQGCCPDALYGELCQKRALFRVWVHHLCNDTTTGSFATCWSHSHAIQVVEGSKNVFVSQVVARLARAATKGGLLWGALPYSLGDLKVPNEKLARRQHAALGQFSADL